MSNIPDRFAPSHAVNLGGADSYVTHFMGDDCPNCGRGLDTYVVGGGQGHDPERGPTGWVEFKGRCGYCRHVKYWSDGWP